MLVEVWIWLNERIVLVFDFVWFWKELICRSLDIQGNFQFREIDILKFLSLGSEILEI